MRVHNIGQFESFHSVYFHKIFVFQEFRNFFKFR